MTRDRSVDYVVVPGGVAEAEVEELPPIQFRRQALDMEDSFNHEVFFSGVFGSLSRCIVRKEKQDMKSDMI